MTVITVLTDFGNEDEYVGVVKGAILCVDPQAVIVDLCHAIGPQDIEAAAWMLRACYPYFPEGSIHLAVVDPGVGTAREIVAVDCDGHRFLAPNNGLLWPIAGTRASADVYRVENRDLFRHPVSPTFHGRDIFAPIAGHLSRGLPMNRLGSALGADGLHRLDGHAAPRVSDGEITGSVVSIDRFGNVITNVARSDLQSLNTGRLAVMLSGHRIQGLVQTYAGHGQGEPVALIGSRNCLEIAINCGNAARHLRVTRGAPVRVIAS